MEWSAEKTHEKYIKKAKLERKEALQKIKWATGETKTGPKKKIKKEKPVQQVKEIKQFDINIFRNLCRIQCTKDEIAAVFETTWPILDSSMRHYHDISASEFKAIHFKAGQACLRRKQLQVAMKGNPSMLKWLGQQYLGQSDKTEVKQSVDIQSQILEARKRLGITEGEYQITDD